MSTATAAPALLLSAAMLASLLRKTTRATASLELRDRLAVPPSLWSGIGVLEACAAVGLVLGLFRPAAGVAAGTGVALLMLGAVAAHVRAGISGRPLLPPAVLLAVAVLAVAGYAVD